MIINLWSTPRTGSVWYSYKLLLNYKETNPNTILMTEPFNKWHLNIYRQIENGVIKNYHEYIDGLFYDDYSLNDSGIVVSNRKYESRVRTVDEEEEHRRIIFRDYNADECTLIVHNHTSPLPNGIYEMLRDIAKRNIYICRNDFVQQMASYAVAIATKRFAKFSNSPEPNFSNLDAPEATLKELSNRIIHWDSLKKSNGEIIKYEEIIFQLNNCNNIPVPVKQNVTDPFDKLSIQTQKIILDLKDHYDRQRNTTTLAF